MKLFVGAVLLCWLAAAITMIQMGFLIIEPTELPIPTVLALNVPVVIFVLWYWISRRFRNFVLGLDLRLLTAMQSWRVIGGMFLVLYHYGLLPARFAYPAGLGDLAIGLAAPFVVLSMVLPTLNWRRHVVWLNVLGLLDFVGVLFFGILLGSNALGLMKGDLTTDIMFELPLSLFPTFLVPLFIMLHIISLIQVRKLSRV